MGMNGKISIYDAQGASKSVQVRIGATLGEVFAAEQGYKDNEKYLILKNGAPADLNSKVGDGDNITITPKSIKGGIS